jgi:hypothetical protein
VLSAHGAEIPEREDRASNQYVQTDQDVSIIGLSRSCCDDVDAERTVVSELWMRVLSTRAAIRSSLEHGLWLESG